MSSTVAGTSWIDQNTISSGTSEVVDIQVKNISSPNGGINLSKGDPVYIYGSVGASARLYVDLADADSTATNNLGDSKMPCVALLDQDLAPNIEGTATVVGKLRNLITNPIDGDVPNENDTVYVKSGGGLTLTKPTGSTNLIQNVGQVGRVSTSSDGNIVVAALLRSNDVPNLPEGRIWIGDGNTIVSDTVYVDEPNNRVGINTAMPTYDLDVDGAIRASEGFIDNEDNSALRVVSPPGGSFRSAFTTVGAIEVTIPNSYVKNDVTFTLEVREGGLTAYTIKIAMRGNIGIDLFPYVVSAYLTSDANKDNNCTIKYESLVPEFDDVKIYVQNPSLGFPSNTGVFITEFTVPATVADGNLAWGLNITSVPAEANATFSNTQVTNWKRNGQDLYYGSGSGNVGIGKTNPGAKLEVVGSTGVIIDSGSSSAAKLTLIGDGSPFGGGASIDVIGGSNDYLSYILNIKRSPSTLEASNSYFQYNAGWEWNGNQSNSRAQPYTSYSFRSQGSSQMVIYNNNLGIGVTTPSQKLHVNGNARVTGSYYDSSNSPGAANSVLISTISGTVWGARGPLGGGTTNYLARWTPDGNTLGIGVTYDNGTSVGIGTTSPGAKTHIFNGTAQNGLIVENSSSSFTDSAIFANNTSTTNGNLLRLRSSASDRMIVSGQGNVGIGTTNPQAKLHVQNYTTGESHQAMFKGGSVNVGDYSYISLNGGYASDYGKEVRLAAVSESAFGNKTGFAVLTSPDSSGASGHERLRVTADGNVGIGTTDPNHELVVEGGTSSPNIELKNTSYSNGGFVLNRANYTQQWKWWAESSIMYFGFSTDESTYSNKLVIRSNGNVGIGATNPLEKLDVVGNIRVSGEQYFNGTVIHGDGKEIIKYSDSWLRINQAQNFTNGIYCGGGILRTDGIFQVGPSGSKFVVNSIGNVGVNGAPSTTTSTKLKVNGTIASTTGSGFQIENGYGSPRLSDFYGSFITTHAFYVGTPYAGLTCTASAFNITSDYRLKENEALLTEASSRIKKLKPIRFNYINSENTVDGFLAHEVAEVIPEAVTGEKDAIREDGSDELQGLDLSKIVPLLTAALQESITKIEKLEQRIQTLENK